MNHTKSAWASPLSEFQQTMDAAAEKLRNQLEDLEPYCGSQALKFAVRAGLQPQMAYTVSETSRYTGVSASTLYAENKAGRLPFKTVGSRNALIIVLGLTVAGCFAGMLEGCTGEATTQEVDVATVYDTPAETAKPRTDGPIYDLPDNVHQQIVCDRQNREYLLLTTARGGVCLVPFLDEDGKQAIMPNA